MDIPGLNPCPCGEPALAVEDPGPEVTFYMIRCSVPCPDQFLTQWHDDPEKAKEAWNAGLWGQ